MEFEEGTLPGVDGVPIYFRRYGQGRRAFIVPNASWLEPDLASLIKDRSVIFYDPRGRGKSGPAADKAQITLEGEMEDLDSVIRHFELDQVVLFGTSYHGGVVANYASRHPAQVLRVIQSSPMSPRRSPHNDQSTARLHARMSSPEIAELMKSPPQSPSERSKVWDAIFSRVYFFDPAAYSRSLARPAELENEQPQHIIPRMNTFMSALGDWDWRPVAAGYPGPVLILHGDADWITVESSQEWQTSFPDARLFLVPNAGHLVWLEQPDMFFAWLNDFLGDSELNNWAWPS